MTPITAEASVWAVTWGGHFFCILNTRLQAFLIEHNVFNKSQTGFLTKHRTANYVYSLHAIIKPYTHKKKMAKSLLVLLILGKHSIQFDIITTEWYRGQRSWHESNLCQSIHWWQRVRILHSWPWGETRLQLESYPNQNRHQSAVPGLALNTIWP